MKTASLTAGTALGDQFAASLHTPLIRFVQRSVAAFNGRRDVAATASATGRNLFRLMCKSFTNPRVGCKSFMLAPALTCYTTRTIVAALGEPNHRGLFVMTLRVWRVSVNDP